MKKTSNPRKSATQTATSTSAKPVAKRTAKRTAKTTATAPRSVAKPASKVTAKRSVKTTSRAAVTPTANSEKLQFIQSRIRVGDFTKIAESTGYHVTHVARVIKGQNGNPSGEIIKAAYARVNKRKAVTA